MTQSESITQPTLDDGFGHWLAGFIDGEGCFSISRVNHPTGVTYQCRFVLGARSDDLAALEEIQRRTGLGTITHRKPQKTSRAFSVWTVASKGDALALVDILTRYPLRARKAADFEIWREGVAHWVESIGRGRRCDWSRMIALRGSLQEGRKFKG